MKLKLDQPTINEKQTIKSLARHEKWNDDGMRIYEINI